MDRRLPPDREAPEPVRIGIAAEQQSLIDEHRAVPHHGRAAEPRQHHPRDQRLDEEEQETADEDRQHEQPAARRGGGHRRPILRRSAAEPRGARDRSGRSDERRVGKAWVSTCRSRWSPKHSKTNTTIETYNKHNSKNN